MTITCPACSHMTDIGSESPSGDWQSASCSACEANFVLVNSFALHDRPSSRTSARSAFRRPSSHKASWWRRIRPWALSAMVSAAAWPITGSILS